MERRTFAVLEFTLENIYYLVMIAASLCGGAFWLGYHMGKNAKE